MSKIESRKKQVLSEVRRFLDLAEKAKKSMDIEVYLHGAKRTLAKLFDDFNLINEFGEAFFDELLKERKGVTYERTACFSSVQRSPYNPR